MKSVRFWVLLAGLLVIIGVLVFVGFFLPSYSYQDQMNTHQRYCRQQTNEVDCKNAWANSNLARVGSSYVTCDWDAIARQCKLCAYPSSNSRECTFVS